MNQKWSLLALLLILGLVVNTFSCGTSTETPATATATEDSGTINSGDLNIFPNLVM